ncbi:hypothetical protein [Variovorax sp. UMC13]|uniref:hypothetical protein n=1 Tax=Variovorax sp. UMC13 TaxID=1862326 RepID=UPI0015FF8169|nr:hypothetical protein [Variovorax sp. UMC13]MBB1603915.1 hypothetical protein [Variovorax sp. UMC13]
MPVLLRHLLCFRRLGALGGLVLWSFVLSLGVAAASPLLQPQALELVCASTGAVKMVVHTADGVQELGAGHLDCPLCLPGGAPPHAASEALATAPLPRGRLSRSVEATRVALAAAPLPARGPPLRA